MLQEIGQKLMSGTAQNKFGGNCGVGNMIMGECSCGLEPVYFCLYPVGVFPVGIGEVGDVSEFNGIYQKRRGENGVTIAKLPWFVTKNPRTIPQQANRGKFGNAVAAWHNLTESERIVYNIESKKTRGTGFNLFIKNYMRA